MLESVCLMACILLLLVVPEDTSTVLTDIGISSSQLESLLDLIVAVVAGWVAIAVCNTVFLNVTTFNRRKRESLDRRPEVRSRSARLLTHVVAVHSWLRTGARDIADVVIM